MGNPVGIFIGTKGQLTFGDFMVWAFPLMLVSLFATTALLLWYFRKELDLFDVNLKERLERGLSIAPVVKVPYMRGLLLIIFTIVAIASHHQTEELLNLNKNSVLLVMPLISFLHSIYSACQRIVRSSFNNSQKNKNGVLNRERHKLTSNEAFSSYVTRRI